jgi:hypothetical protein
MRAAVASHIECAIDIIDREALVGVLDPLHFARSEVRGFANENLIGHAWFSRNGAAPVGACLPRGSFRAGTPLGARVCD